MIPRIAHFVFGLAEQDEPFHFLHYASLESCRRVLAPERIYFHHAHLPWGPWWERIRTHLTLVEVGAAPEVLAADYSLGVVPESYLYAHHSDFIRLDALLTHGGLYADIDTIFIRPFPDELFAHPFVIGRETPVADATGTLRPSLCNALMLSEPGAAFARAWRERMAAALDGSWSNHSGFLSEELAAGMPAAVRIEPEARFFPFPPTVPGLRALLEASSPIPAETLSVHLWAHLWWARERRDFSLAHGERYIPRFIRGADTTLAQITRPHLPEESPGRAWGYLSLDEDSGYGEAARRCMDALEASGLTVSWTPFAPGGGWGHGYQPAPGSAPCDEHTIVAHLVPEYVPLVRARHPDAFLVAHTAWETDLIPEHWVACLDTADLIVVPSQFSAQAVAASPVSGPVAVVPHAIAPPGRPQRATWAGIPAGTVVFYTISEWTERKGITKTIEAYLRAFSGRDDVLLIVKTSPRDRRVNARGRTTAGRGTSALALAELLARHSDPPPVRLITRRLSGGQIAALHERGDCFVSLTRGEGWGIGAFDAATVGTPVVITGHGGQLDYLAGSPLLVRFALAEVVDPAGGASYSAPQHWAEPDVDHAVALLRELAADRRRAAARARPLAAEIRERFSPAAVSAALRAAVAEHAPTASPRGR